jgi:hypothetical protein
MSVTPRNYALLTFSQSLMGTSYYPTVYFQLRTSSNTNMQICEIVTVSDNCKPGRTQCVGRASVGGLGVFLQQYNE